MNAMRDGAVIEDKWGGVYLLLERVSSSGRWSNNEGEWKALVLVTQSDGRSAGMNPVGGIDRLTCRWIEQHTQELTQR